MSNESPPHRAAAARLAEEGFRERFGTAPELTVRAPGRVNLIGEHTDYNDGYVLPFAIGPAVYVAAGASEDRLVHAYSVEYGELDTVDPNELSLETAARPPSWRDYVRGVAWALEAGGWSVPGCCLAIAADLPQRAGLSSSAALEVGVGLAFQTLSGTAMRRRDLAQCCQRAENEFVGLRCGIMDQLAVALAEPGAVLLIDTRTTTIESVPLPPSLTFAVVDSGSDRALAASGYNQRRAECETAVAAARAGGLPIDSLRDLTEDDLHRLEGMLEPRLLRRARHVVEENARVLAAVEALRAGDVEQLGQLMLASHRSLRDLYEVSTERLDTIVELAIKVDGIYGARLTGAGFGGSVLVMIDRDRAEGSLNALRDALERRFGEPLPVREVAPAGAASLLPSADLPEPEQIPMPDGRTLRLYRFESGG